MGLTSSQQAMLSQWGITALESADEHPFVWWGRDSGDHVVVKAGDPADRDREARALRAFASGAVRPVRHDRDLGLLVVPRVLPGDDIRPLARRDDDAATREIALLARRLHGEGGAGDGLPGLASLGTAFDADPDDRLPRRLVAAARAVFEELIVSSPEPVVLHGDLHHMNVLNSLGHEREGQGREGQGRQGRWIAIDPHGWQGDPAFEAAAMLANPRGMVEEGGDARGMDGTDLARRVGRRTEVYAEVAGWDVQRVRAWAFVGCVVAELWMLEGHGLVHGAPMAVAETLMAEGL